MGEANQLTRYIESFVDTSRSSSQQAESLEAIATLVKKDILTIETLIKEMGMYLTTTDNIIRGRGLLLLGEVLMRLASKPLDSATIHSLIGFFTERLADWKAFRGALIGCLGMVKRNCNAGILASDDAKAVAHSYIQNLQVQSLGQYDRKLCFELLECLLESYPDEVASLGDDLVYGVCEAIDGEKDPHCLVITFHIVEIVAKLFPDPSGTVASYAGELFEILGCYFPIHFTHAKDEDVEIKRDDLSRSLMLAFSATPLFEPFAIPLLLEKLSSSLLSAKVDSLKYLSDCSLKYGAERMEKHSGAIWSSIKDAMYTSVEEPVLSFGSESLNGLGLGFCENEIATEALELLQKVLMQNNDQFLSLIIGDEDVCGVFNTINNYSFYNDIPSKSKQKLHSVGRIIHVSARTSIAFCNRVFQSFFPGLLDHMGLSVRNSSGNQSSDKLTPSGRLKFGALYLCVELLAACKDLLAGSEEFALEYISTNETCLCMLQTFSSSLVESFCSSFITSSNRETHEAETYFGVKGLQVLATFPGDYSPISKAIFENILLVLMSIIISNFKNTLLWKLALRALVHIGSSVQRYPGSEKALSYMEIVVEKIVSLVSLQESTMPLTLKLEAVSEVGTSGRSYMFKIVLGLEEAIFSHLSEVYIQENSRAAESVVLLLECYSTKVIPWIHETGDSEEVLLRFTINIWNQIEKCMVFSSLVKEKVLLDATMRAIKLAVMNSSLENQTTIMQKAHCVLSTSMDFPRKGFSSDTRPVQMEVLDLSHGKENSSDKDDWILSLFSSVTMAVRPQTYIPHVRLLLQFFMISFLRGSVPAAQALGSVINKLSLKSGKIDVSSDCTLEEAMDVVFKTKFRHIQDNGTISHSEFGLTELCFSVVDNSLLQVNAIVGLAWIGKGLLLRGHEKVKDITMVLLECLLSDGSKVALQPNQGLLERTNKTEFHSLVIKSAADAFHILMSDSEACLNCEFHASLRPLHKQRFFSTMMPILQSLVRKTDSSLSRCMLYRAFAHIISDTPQVVVLGEAKKLLPMLLDVFSMLRDVQDKDILYSLLLVLSGILMDKNGQETVTENAHIVINCLTELVAYPHMMLVRETAIQCLIAVSALPHASIFPMRSQVLHCLSKALDDRKRAVRREAVKCRRAWA